MTPAFYKLIKHIKKIPQFKKNCGKKMTSAFRNTVKVVYEEHRKVSKPK